MQLKPFDWIQRSGELIACPIPQYTVCVSKSESFGGKFIVVVNNDEPLMNGRKVATFDNSADAMATAHFTFEKIILDLVSETSS